MNQIDPDTRHDSLEGMRARLAEELKHSAIVEEELALMRQLNLVLRLEAETMRRMIEVLEAEVKILNANKPT